MSYPPDQPFASANSQSIATLYVYSYLGNRKKECFKLLSNDFHGVIRRNGKVQFDGGEREFEIFMSKANFGTMKRCDDISLHTSTVNCQPVVKVVSLQYHKLPESKEEEIEPNMVKDEIEFVIKEEKDKILRISSIKHNYFTIYFPDII